MGGKYFFTFPPHLNGRDFLPFDSNPDHFSPDLLPYGGEMSRHFPPIRGRKKSISPPSLSEMGGKFPPQALFPPHSEHPISPPYGGEKLSMFQLLIIIIFSKGTTFNTQNFRPAAGILLNGTTFNTIFSGLWAARVLPLQKCPT